MKYLFPFFFSSIISFLLTFPTIIFAKKFNIVTDKKKRYHPAHTHRGLIPRAGGLPIYFSILISTLFFCSINKIIFGILLSSFLLIIIGLLDDIFDLSPYHRFFYNIFLSICVVGFGLGIPYISNPFGGIIRLDQHILTVNFLGAKKILIFADLLAVIWLVALTNIINWSKGVDGQLPGFVSVAAIFLGILAQRFSAHDISIQTTAIFSFIIAGAFLGFLPWNFYPQKIMPGYGGGALAGFLLGILSILSFGKIGTFLLVLSVPLIDGLYTICRRIYQKKSPFRADWGHLHHRLLEIGWGRRRIAIFYWLISVILGFASLFLKGKEKLIFLISFFILMTIFIILINQVKKTKIVK